MGRTTTAYTYAFNRPLKYTDPSRFCASLDGVDPYAEALGGGYDTPSFNDDPDYGGFGVGAKLVEIAALMRMNLSQKVRRETSSIRSEKSRKTSRRRKQER